MTKQEALNQEEVICKPSGVYCRVVGACPIDPGNIIIFHFGEMSIPLSHVAPLTK